MSTGTTNGHAKELILKIALGIAGTACLLLAGIVAWVGREGLQKMDALSAKIDYVAQGMSENRLRVVVLEENRKADKENQQSIIRELQALNRKFPR